MAEKSDVKKPNFLEILLALILIFTVIAAAFAMFYQLFLMKDRFTPNVQIIDSYAVFLDGNIFS